MEEVTRFASYQEYKAAFDAETERVKVGFVRIGYLLRIAEDTDILRESGYASMEEFAWKEYHIDASQASRFKNINRRFSEGGYSDRLQERFQGYGVAKLGELLTLSDEIIETLPPELTRSEIQEVKKEVAEEEKITDLEVMLEEPEGEGNNLEKWLDVYFRDNPDEFLKIRPMYLQPDKAQAIMDILAPSGIAAKMVRIKGAGKFLLSIKGKELPIELLNIRTNEKETYSMEECFRAMRRICPYTIEPQKAYEARYGQSFPQGEIAPVQPEKPAAQNPENTNKTLEKPDRTSPKTEKTGQEAGKREKTTGFAQEKSNKHLDISESEESKIAPVQPETENLPETPPETEASAEEEKRTGEEPRQFEIEDYPEALPEGYIKCHDGSEVKESIWEEGENLARELYAIFSGKDRECLGKVWKIADQIMKIAGTLEEEGSCRD